MSVLRGIAAVLIALGVAGAAQAGPMARWMYPVLDLDTLNRGLQGKVLDFTHNHGEDNRIWSDALGEKRDLYVYVPPGYDSRQAYPLIILFHGFLQDEAVTLRFADVFDRAIVSGALPPMIVAAPDGSIRGKPTTLNAGSFYVNSKAGRFEDFVMQDVWSFLHRRFCIRPEREAHGLVGGSMGGFAAYNLGIKYKDRIGVVAGIMPPLNLRYIDCHGRYFSKFDPECLGWREHFRPFMPVARFYIVFPVRERRLTIPLYGHLVDAMDRVRLENPAEMLGIYDVRPGELEMFVAYGGRDEFNIEAQAESFLYIARQRGLEVTSVYHPDAHHSVAAAKEFTPELFCWLKPRLAPYAPASCVDPCGPNSSPGASGADGPAVAPLCLAPKGHSPAIRAKGLRHWIQHWIH